MFTAILNFNRPIYSAPTSAKSNLEQVYQTDLIEFEHQIHIPGYPAAFNPSIIQVPQGYLLTFRIQPDEKKPWISNIGIILLDEYLAPISKSVILNMRGYKEITPSQAEDARIMEINNRLFLIYNDNVDIINPTRKERRDMYLAEIVLQGSQFHVKKPIKIIHEENYTKETWQKNWMPFAVGEQIYIVYSIRPHEIIIPDLKTGVCKVVSSSIPFFSWRWGTLRGGTPALLIDDVYLTFFHSSMSAIVDPSLKDAKEVYTYFMGAYTFSPVSPFEIMSVSPKPIITKQFYEDNVPKKVIFPGGFVVVGEKILLAYGRNDSEIWIATIDKNKLMGSMRPVSNNIITRPDNRNSLQLH